MFKGGEPVHSAGSSAHPHLVELTGPHRERLKPLFDKILRDVIKVDRLALHYTALGRSGSPYHPREMLFPSNRVSRPAGRETRPPDLFHADIKGELQVEVSS